MSILHFSYIAWDVHHTNAGIKSPILGLCICPANVTWFFCPGWNGWTAYQVLYFRFLNSGVASFMGTMFVPIFFGLLYPSENTPTINWWLMIPVMVLFSPAFVTHGVMRCYFLFLKRDSPRYKRCCTNCMWCCVFFKVNITVYRSKIFSHRTGLIYCQFYNSKNPISNGT